jgi:hypothetical protein
MSRVVKNETRLDEQRGHCASPFSQRNPAKNWMQVKGSEKYRIASIRVSGALIVLLMNQ